LDRQITELLQRVRAGDASASDELIPVVYAELHRIARRHLRKERQDHTLQPTALVNEVYLRMFENSSPQFADRAHFMGVASRITRSILVDYARTRGAAKRGGHDQRIELDAGLGIAVKHLDAIVSLLDLDLAIEALAQENPAPAQAIEMRYFGGMTAEETAEAVGRSIHIVQHELRFAHAWLRRRLGGAPGAADSAVSQNQASQRKSGEGE
jgi:RNA polymerase sigma-70 factor (ECF subfamily)